MNNRSDDPMQYASGYTLDLYCDHWLSSADEHHEWREFPHQITGESWGEVSQKARKRGWIIHVSTRTATCPKCSGKRKLKPL